MTNTIRLKIFDYNGLVTNHPSKDGGGLVNGVDLSTIKPLIKENINKTNYSFLTLLDLHSLYKNNSNIAINQFSEGEVITTTNLFILDFDIILYKSLSENQLNKYQSIIFEQFRQYSSIILPNKNNFTINPDSSLLSYRLIISCNKPINIDNSQLNTYYNYYIKLCYFISKHIDLIKSNLNDIKIVIKPNLKNGRINKTFLGYNKSQSSLVKLGDSIASNVDLINNYYYQTQSIFNQWEYEIKELTYKLIKF